jgi:hypothetical protein
MNFAFFNHPLISIGTNNDWWHNWGPIIIPIIISAITLGFSIYVLHVNQHKTKKSEQIKMTQDIQTMYYNAFEKYASQG